MEQKESSLLIEGRTDRGLSMTLSFDHLTYTIKGMKGKPDKVLLNDVSGMVKPGSVLAIMGSSGAGKTTLLDVLANRASKGELQGSITINGETLSSKQSIKAFRRLSGYVMQDDSLIDSLTVYETLDYVARLKLPHLTSEQRKERIERIIVQLRLSNVRDNYIGSQFKRGLSGGEKKRVSIGVELITSPNILFLDEPTSGLDGASAYTVMKTIVDLAQTGCCVICTIHQPRSNIFTLFDQLLLLSAGRVAYMGPANYAMNYFENLGFSMSYVSNPSDWMLDLVTGTVVEGESDNQQKLIESKIDFATEYQRSELYQKMDSERKNYKPDASNGAVRAAMQNLSSFASSRFYQSWVLFKRTSLSNIRNPSIIWLRLFQAIVMAIIMGSIFWQVPDTTEGIKGRISALFFSITFVVMSSFASMPVLIEERGRFNREILSNMYSPVAYFAANFLSILPFLTLFSVSFGLICYFMVGLVMDVYNIFFYLVVLVVLSLVGDAMVKAVGALVKQFSVAAAMTSIVMTVFMFFSGFFINASQLPSIWRWAPYISPFKYGLQAIMIIEFEGMSFACPEDSNPCAPISGDTVLEFFDISTKYNPWWDVGVLALIWGALMFLQLMFLMFLNKEKR